MSHYGLARPHSSKNWKGLRQKKTVIEKKIEGKTVIEIGESSLDNLNFKFNIFIKI